MVVVKIGDGMGNQLFNYACGYAAARRDGEKLKLDTSECDNSTLRKFELDNFCLRYDARESFPNRNIVQKLYKKIRRNIKYHVILEREVYHNKDGRYDVNDIDPRVFAKKHVRDKYLQGYWQHLPYFAEYLDEITAMLQPAYAQSTQVKALIQEFQTKPTCAVHVRGGDIGGPGERYFEEAIRQMEQRKPGLCYVVFTNDRPKAEAALNRMMEGKAVQMRYIADAGTFSDVDEFFLMAACQNQILSNSTFSTWAAYLNPYKEKTVIMPEDILSERMRLPGWLIV